MNPIRILIVDDHSIFRKGIRSALESFHEFEVIGEAGNGLDAIRMAVDTAPDIVLMDIAMPGCSGQDAAREIKRLVPGARIVMLTVSDADEDLFQAVKNGAQGYLQKDLNVNELGAMLLRVVNGEALLSGVLAARILKEFHQERPDPKLAGGELLTAREVEVMTLVVKGLSNREIAGALFITENTVKHHLTNILDKLHLQNRIQLAVYTIQEGLVKRPV